MSDGSHDGFLSFQLPLHHLDLQLFHLVGTLCPVLVLFCYKGIVEAVRSCIEILHNQISYISFVLARLVQRTFMTTVKYIPLLNQTSLPIKIMFIGVMLAILEHLGYILPVIDEKGKVETLTAGSIAAGYQNFLICIEMFFAAIALKYAFPISVYIGEGSINAEGRSVTMQSISSSLKVL